MSERKSCVRCQRAIDAWAAICPFCNWSQAAIPPTEPRAVPVEVVEYKPPSEFNLKKKALLAGAGALLLVASFAVGMVINSDGTPRNAPETLEQKLEEQREVPPPRRANTPLIPTNERGGIEQPITSAPAAAPGEAPDDYRRTDATAVSATEYEALAKRAKAEKEKMATLVDPRTLTGPAYAQAPRRPRPPASQTASQSTEGKRISLRTRPVPEHQPLPQLFGAGTARLSLLIGADGRVKRINIDRPLRRDTADLISAVQSWRFKPATENGEAVAAPYSVEISFKQ